MIQTSKKTDKEIANDKARRMMNGVATWCSFYRANPHRFCADYLNIHLKLFQKILIFMMNYCHYFMYLASRGQGKTFLVAIFCVVRCILYPGTRICICSKNRKQATEVIDKIVTILMPNSANLRLEIEKWVCNNADAFVNFRNGSLIKIVTAADSGRGARANILIVDEFRLVDLNIINTVLRKFLTAPRQPKYLNNPKYAHLAERNKEIYMSSAWFQSHWSYEKAKAYCANLVDDTKRYFICGLPYQLAIKENLLSADQVADEMSEQDFNELSWVMEMECLWYGDTDGSFFNYEDISKNRILKNAVYPSYLCSNINDKKCKIPDLAQNEKRILSVDIALLASKKQNNDAASIIINSALPTSNKHYISNIIYMENHEGLRTNELASIVRRLFDMFKCTDLVIDGKSMGIGIYDALSADMYDPEYGVTYSALNCCNDPTFTERCTDKNAPKVIWVIQASAAFNSSMYINLREAFRQNKINLLISDFESEEILETIRGYDNLSLNDKINLQIPYIQTTLLVNELINLEYKVNGTNIQVYEKSGHRKDRVSSIGYNYYVVCQIENKLRSKNLNTEKLDFSGLCRRPTIARNT